MACGGACAVSTAMDYMRFAQMLLNGGVLGVWTEEAYRVAHESADRVTH